MCEERLIDPLCSFLQQRDGRGADQMGLAKARPRPLDRVFDEPSTDRIAQHIAEDGEEMAVLLNGKTFEASLPHMPMTPVVPMIAADMTGHPPLHEAAQRSGCGRLHHEMKMIRHQTEAQHLDWMFGFRRGEQVEERGVVAVTMKNCAPPFPRLRT